MIREESEKLKKRIYEYERRLTNQVEVCNSELMSKKEQLEESRNKVQRWLRDSHVTEQIQQRQQMSEELKRYLDVELNCELTSRPAIVYLGECFLLKHHFIICRCLNIYC